MNLQKSLKIRRSIALLFFAVATILGIIFFLKISFPVGLGDYFSKTYYGQFGPLAICVELFIAAYYLFVGHRKANFTLALFAFTALLDIVFNIFGLFISGVPTYGMIIFFLCAIVSLRIAFSKVFDLGRITLLGALVSFVLGNASEFFFNYL